MHAHNDLIPRSVPVQLLQVGKHARLADVPSRLIATNQAKRVASMTVSRTAIVYGAVYRSRPTGTKHT